MDGHRFLLDVPVDQDAAAAVARVPFGEQVLVVGAEVRRVGRDCRGALPPDRGVAGGERRVGELDGDGAGAVDGEVPAGGVAQVGFAVAVVAGSDGADPGVRAVRVEQQQEAFPEHRAGERLARADGGELAQHPGPQRRFGDHVDQRHLPPALPDRFLQAPQVPRLELRTQGREFDRAALAVGDPQPVQAG